MADKIFRPRRGKASTMESKGTVLAKGEMFFEVPDTGVGTGACKIKMGDGTSAYSDLPYAVDLDEATTDVGSTAVAFTASTTTDDDTLLTEVASGKTVSTLFGSVKTLLSNLVSEVTQLNNDYQTLSDKVGSGSGGTIDIETGILYLSGGIIDTETGILSL